VHFKLFGLEQKWWLVTLTTIVSVITATASRGLANDQFATQLPWVASPPALTDVERVNEFIDNSEPTGSEPGKNGGFTEGLKIKARLLTPLNSTFSRSGDPVIAVISEAAPGELGSLLPTGTRLYGNVEFSRPSSRPRKDGLILIKFYEAAANGRRIDLQFALSSQDRLLHPVSLGMTRKQKVRSFLIMTSRITIPLAIGSGGISMAITAGAGALIGGVLADNHKYLQGALQGAWESSILSAFDPLVYKGGSVVIPWGSVITLRLEDESCTADKTTTSSPVWSRHPLRPNQAAALLSQPPPSGPRAILTTSARLLKEHAQKESAVSSRHAIEAAGTPADQAVSELAKAQKFIDEKNLAAALGAIDKASALQPTDPRIEAERDKLYQMVTGGPSKP
jgi:hypothetical protein